ncbi:adenylate/guanylate cyclase domain-containing protein [Candidatus Amarolinea aalborgensis]|uniref:adenylate/guanylate cyclase domain-containing protein n=1 Tax=Candidatus Amarolinea aalborgensis TaxID=2249329 RepID=UPI003BF9CF0E
MICSICQTPNRDGAHFCRQCGALLSGQCPRCGAAAPPNANYCDHCGLPLSPRSQATWWLERPSASAQPWERSTDSPASPRAVEAAPTPTAAQPALQQYIPKELLAKLEAAQARGAMLGERRIVTMLFCDVKGSTRAAAELDPEEWSEVINGAFELMIRPVYQYEGMVARLMGDGILAFFGAPIAHEDDPQRAVLAGLEILRGLAGVRDKVQRQWGIDLDARVGINTGLVVVGAVGSDLRVEYTALGDAINLAARMEQTAAPGTVQVAEATYRLVAAHFEFKDLGEVQVKGKDQPVRAYQVLSRRTVAGADRNAPEVLSPLVGRGQELATLIDRVETVQAGRGAIVALIGEAGLGKSRLLHETIAAWQARQEAPSNCYEIAALSYESMQAYGLVRRLMRRALDITAETEPAEARARIADTVSQLAADSPALLQQAIETLFGVSATDGQPPLEGEGLKRQLFAAVELIWRQQMRQRPLLLVLDDLHWADSASLELLGHLFSLAEREAVLFMVALRPDRASPAWRTVQATEADHPHLTTEIALRPLPAHESLALVEELLGAARLPARFSAAILARAEGNPLFVEEIVRALHERGDHASAAGASLDLPATLQALLTARLDRLDEPLRHVLQLASVLGRTFSYRVLRRLVNGGDTLDEQLISLQRMGLILESARRPEREYSFQQTLIQEAVYSTILLRQRRKYHELAARAIEEIFGERLAELAPVLARHFDEAHVADRAVEYYWRAGAAAMRLYATAEALVHFDRGVALIGANPDLPTELAVRVYDERGRALELCSRFEEARQNFLDLEQLALVRRDARAELAALTAQGRLHSGINPLYDPTAAHALAERARALAHDMGDRTAEVEILWNLMNQERFAEGRLQQAVVYGEQALALARTLGSLNLLPYIVNDLGDVYGSIGEFRRSLELLAEARSLWRSLGNEPMLADSLTGSGVWTGVVGDHEAALTYLDEAMAISERIKNIWGKAYSRGIRGWILFDLGQLGRAVDELSLAAQEAQEAGFLFGRVYTRLMLALTYSELGMIEAALGAATEAVSLATEQMAQLAVPSQALLLFLGVRAGRPDAPLASRLGQHQDDDGMSNALQFYFLGLAMATWALHQGNAQEALTLSEAMLARTTAAGAATWAVDAALLRAEALLALDRREEAFAQLQQAEAAVEAMQLHRAQWHVLLALADLEESRGEHPQAQQHRGRARAEIEVILANTSRPDQQAAFLAQPKVRRLLETAASAGPPANG